MGFRGDKLNKFFVKHLSTEKKDLFSQPVFQKPKRAINQAAMDTLSYKTISANKETANKEWVLVNAEGQTLGRLCSQVAAIIRGKHKTNFTPHADCGDNVVVINADKINLTGKKWDQKVYIRYTGYPGGQRFATPKEMMAKKPTAMIEMAVRGMLPKSRLGRHLLNNLYVYAGAEHNQEAQKPKEIKFN